MAEFRSSSRTRDVGDESAFARVADSLLAWDIHRAAGFRLIEAPVPAEVGAKFIAKAPFFPVTSRCEVTAVVDEPDRRGFTYRTLPGHPLDGEETFLVELRQGRVNFSVAEHSRPATHLTRLPGARWVQARINERYLNAAQRVGAAARSRHST